ncbi:hypothetical protein [Rhodococcus sp. NPDC049939]|uniref:hypothetical protein n=1 Tax=Rhodococcus sp. NPDC049939 TaxID=3155511 RepID=UPI0033D64E41
MENSRKIAFGAVAVGSLCFVGPGTAVADPNSPQPGSVDVDPALLQSDTFVGNLPPMPVGTYKGISSLPFVDQIWNGKTFGFGTVVDDLNVEFPALFGMTFQDVNGDVVTDYSPAGMSFLTDRITMRPDGSYEGSFYINDVPVASFILHKDLPPMDEMPPLDEMPALDEMGPLDHLPPLDEMPAMAEVGPLDHLPPLDEMAPLDDLPPMDEMAPEAPQA